MARKAHKVIVDEQTDLTKPVYDFIINSASLRDDFCDYTFEMVKGEINIGNKETTKSKAGTAKDSLLKAFSVFNVHMAVASDLFKHAGYTIENIDMEHGHELATIFDCRGFSMQGSEDNESISLSGYMLSTIGGRIKMDIPKILIDKLSSYTWKNELKAAADMVRYEVSRYKMGNYIPVAIEEIEEKAEKKQTKMTFLKPEGEEDVPAVVAEVDAEDNMEDFQSAEL